MRSLLHLEQSSADRRIKNFDRLLQEGLFAFKNGELGVYREKIQETSRELRFFCENGQGDIALSLEARWYPLVKQVESESHYAESFSGHFRSLWDLGSRCSPGSISYGNSNKIAFVAQNSVLLGHTEVMLLMMEYWKRHYPRLDMVFLGMTPCHPSLDKRLSAIGIRSRCIKKVLSPTESTQWLRDTIHSEDAGVSVWLSLPLWAPYIYGFRVAKRQVFWSLKFHAVHLGPEVVHIGMTKKRDGVEIVNGYPWLAFQPPLAVSVTPRSEIDRAKTRGEHDSTFIFATLAREEKFNSPRFVEAISEILKRTPSAIFLFTGRSIPHTLKKALEDKGVWGRAIFIGWVDTDMVANAIDCFLETFPFGCGVTGMQALRHSAGVISLWDTDTLPTFCFDDYQTASSFHPNWAISRNVDGYIDAAVKRYECWHRGERSREDINLKIDELEAPRYARFHDLITGESC
jgi:hypothetical protein